MEQIIIFSASFTRPANTTAYTAQDTVNDGTNRISFSPMDGMTLYTPSGSSLVESNALTSGKSILIKTVRLITNSTTTTNGSFRLSITDRDQTAIADNSPQTMLFANKAGRCGYADLILSTGGTGSDSAEAFVSDVNIVVKSESSNFSADLIATAAYVPTSGQQFYLELGCIVI